MSIDKRTGSGESAALEARDTSGRSILVSDPTSLTTAQIFREVESLRDILEQRLDGMDKIIDAMQGVVNRSPTINEVVAKYDERFDRTKISFEAMGQRMTDHSATVLEMFDERDKAVTLLNEVIRRSPTVNELNVKFDKELESMVQRFLNMDKLFIERDKALQQVHDFIQGNPRVIETAVRTLRELHEEKFTSIQIQFRERDTRTEQSSKDSKVAVDAALQAAKEAVGEQNKSSALAISKSEAATTKQIDALNTVMSTMEKGLDDKIDDLRNRITGMEGNSKGRFDAWGILLGAIGLMAGLGALIGLLFRATGK